MSNDGTDPELIQKIYKVILKWSKAGIEPAKQNLLL